MRNCWLRWEPWLFIDAQKGTAYTPAALRKLSSLSKEYLMNNSRRSFLGKAPAAALAAGVGVASAKIATASPVDGNEGTRPLLDAIIAGQRKINGRLYAANELLLEVLRTIVPLVPINQAAAIAKLAEAEDYIEAVPGEPPGCELPPGYGGGYGGGD
jgi:hypothetical protein